VYADNADEYYLLSPLCGAIMVRNFFQAGSETKTFSNKNTVKFLIGEFSLKCADRDGIAV